MCLKRKASSSIREDPFDTVPQTANKNLHNPNLRYSNCCITLFRVCLPSQSHAHIILLYALFEQFQNRIIGITLRYISTLHCTHNDAIRSKLVHNRCCNLGTNAQAPSGTRYLSHANTIVPQQCVTLPPHIYLTFGPAPTTLP